MHAQVWQARLLMQKLPFPISAALLCSSFAPPSSVVQTIGIRVQGSRFGGGLDREEVLRISLSHFGSGFTWLIV
ncbi:hypothetical protein KC19_VG318300 [Ceratodon purpureus]|uniref:Secreted protein n=1 Tax=Ceratodon purpureus TaxID=3225 RepID=A0A8T0HWK2_CERPU|nr:hypothetical protein KC19_VG318300 [Ceratodon purpureus]